MKDYDADLLGSEAGFHKALKILQKRLEDPSDKVQFASAEALWRIVDFTEEEGTKDKLSQQASQSGKPRLLQ